MTEAHKAKAQEIKADDTLRQRLVAFIEKHGEKEAIRLLETPRQTLARVAAGFSVRRATLAFLHVQLDKLAPVDLTDGTKGAGHAAE